MECDFSLLTSTPACLFNKCELIIVFGHIKATRTFFNIFSIVVFENTIQKEKSENITSKLSRFTGQTDFSWGIRREVVNIAVAKEMYTNLVEQNLFKVKEDILDIGKLTPIQKQYVEPVINFVKHPINAVLKNNFHHGSYVLEFFDEQKKNTRFLFDNEEILEQFSCDVNSYLPIELANLSDRLGNVIFQFPLNGFDLSLTNIVEENPRRYSGIKLELYPKIKEFLSLNLFLHAFEEHDGLVTRTKFVKVVDLVAKARLDDCFGTYVQIFDPESSLILYQTKFRILKGFGNGTRCNSARKRVFKLGEEEAHVSVSGGLKLPIRQRSSHEWIEDRQLVSELKLLQDQRYFIQYLGGADDEKKALLDIRWLIKKYGTNGAYLWDPYLSAIDIKKSLYFCRSMGTKLKAITGLKQAKNKTLAISQMQQEFNKDDLTKLFLDLEVRGRFGNHGWNFHDRFLIFPLESPRAWSLGISVNGLGRAHHILQEVRHAPQILQEFNRMWVDLDCKECLIWKA